VAKRKRASGEGTYKKRTDGRWEAQYIVYTPSGAKRKSVYARTKHEVAQKLRKAIAERDGGLVFDADNLSLAEYLRRWLEGSVRGSVAKSTFERYEQLSRVHIAPAIGRVELKKLTPAHVQGLYRAKLDEGLAERTVEYIHTTLRKALNQAVKWQLVPRNAADATTAPRPRKQEMTALDREQARRLLNTARGDRFEALYVLAVAAGLRQGELLGLKWVDLDLEKGMLSVRRSLRMDKDGAHYTEGKRDRSRRRIELGGGTVGALRAHRKRQLEERVRYTGLWEDHGLVFCQKDGRPVHRRHLEREFYKLLERAGLPKITFHGLRHTCASLMLLNNTPAKVVSEMLGHADVAFTLKVYSHVLPGMQRSAADGMDEMLF
jgi:integrase